jgi:hypothetical protein
VSMNKALPVVILLAVVAAIVSVLFVSAGSRPHSPRFAAAELLAIAQRVGRQEGDSHPTHIAAVRTTYEPAVSVLIQGEVNGVRGPDVPVEVITMYGDFTITPLSPPPGYRVVARPRWQWVTMTLSSKTGKIIDLDSGEQQPPLERLGRVRYVVPNGSG